LRSKPLAGRKRKIRTAQAVAMQQGAARGRPQRATNPQEAWRKTRNNQYCPVEGAHQRFKAVRGTNRETRRASRSNASQREEIGRQRTAVAGSHVGGACGRQNAAGCSATQRLLRQEFDAGRAKQFAGPAGGSFTARCEASCKCNFPAIDWAQSYGSFTLRLTG
jgi:hypothetical protein